MKKQGLKAALPLLLLATACGDGTPSASQFDALTLEPSDDTQEVVTADTEGFDSLSPLGEALKEAEATATSDEGAASAIAAVPSSDTATQVPEPTTLAGLAIAALGLGAIKRKQSA